MKRFEKQMAHQCSVKYKDLTLYAILLYHQQVLNAQSDLIEKCLHSIVFNMTKFVPNKEHPRTALIFCFHLKKTAAESYRLLIVNMLHRKKTCERWFQRFKIGDFDVADKEHGKLPKKYEDLELQALLDEDDSQIQKQLAEQLSVNHNKLFPIAYREMGKIQKVGRLWFALGAYELNETNGEAQKHM